MLSKGFVQQASDAHHAAKHAVKSVLHLPLDDGRRRTCHTVAHRQSTPEEVQQEHLFPSFNLCEVLFNRFNREGSRGQQFEKRTLLLVA